MHSIHRATVVLPIDVEWETAKNHEKQSNAFKCFIYKKKDENRCASQIVSVLLWSAILHGPPHPFCAETLVNSFTAIMMTMNDGHLVSYGISTNNITTNKSWCLAWKYSLRNAPPCSTDLKNWGSVAAEIDSPGLGISFVKGQGLTYPAACSVYILLKCS